jgi:hypothetical protein
MSLKFVRSSVPVGVRQSGKWQRRVWHFIGFVS